MRPVPLGVLAFVTVVACTARDNTPPADSAAGTAAPMAAAPMPSLTSRAGTWEGRSMDDGSDSVVATWRLVSTADTTGWTIAINGAAPIPMHVLSAAGDSVVTEFGPFDSPVRHQRVRVRSVGRLVGADRQQGTYEVHPVSGDSVTRGRWEGRRVP